MKTHFSVYDYFSLAILAKKMGEKKELHNFFLPFKENNLKVQWNLGDRSQLLPLQKNISNGTQDNIFLLMSTSSAFKISIKRRCVGKVSFLSVVTGAVSTGQQEPSAKFLGILPTRF